MSVETMDPNEQAWAEDALVMKISRWLVMTPVLRGISDEEKLTDLNKRVQGLGQAMQKKIKAGELTLDNATKLNEARFNQWKAYIEEVTSPDERLARLEELVLAAEDAENQNS